MLFTVTMFSVKLDVVHYAGEDGLTDAMAELLRNIDMRDVTWREIGVSDGGGWPEVEIIAPLPTLINLIQNYFGGDRTEEADIPWADVLETLKSIKMYG